MNSLRLQIYSSGSTLIKDIPHELDNISGLWYETGYPGGRYLAGGCYIPRLPTKWWEINGPKRVVIRSSQAIVYEGIIQDNQHNYAISNMGNSLDFVGYWAWLMMNRRMRKRWCDDRVDEQTWEWLIGASVTAKDKCTIKRDSRLYFLPKAEAWANTEMAIVRYTMPQGETVKKITFDYDVTGVGGEDWDLKVYDRSNTSLVATYNQAGAGSTTGSASLSAPGDFTACNQIEFWFEANGAQTPTSDGATYAKITNLKVYSEIEAAPGINLDSVAADIITAYSSVLNSDTNYLDASNTRGVEPFITAGDGYEAIGDILVRIAGHGDTDDEPYAVGLLHSEKAASPDGKPVLFTEDWPVTDNDSDYDYFLSLDDPNVSGNVTITRDYSQIVNNVTIGYRDEQGWLQYLTSSGDGGLADSDSQDDYGQRDATLNIGNATSTTAGDYGTRYIQKYKDPQWVVSGSIDVIWAIEGVNGEAIGASRVEAGKRLKIDGYDIFVISRTRYDHDSRTVSITVGEPQDLIFTQEVFETVWNDPDPLELAAGSYGAGGRTGAGPGIGGLTGTEKWKKKWNRGGQPEKWQKFKRYLQKYRREGKGNFKAGKKAFKKEFGEGYFD